MNYKDVLPKRQFSTTQGRDNEFLIHKTLLDNLPCIAMILKKGTREIVASNKAARDIGAVPGKTCFGTCVNREDKCPFCLAPEVWATNEPRRLEVKYRGAYYEGIWVPLSDDLYVHYIFDISEREQAKETLQKEKIFIYAALDSQIDTFFVFDTATWKAIRWNKAFRNVSGYTDEEIASLKAPDAYLSNEDLNKAAIFINKVLKKGTGKIELVLICKDGSLVPTEYLVSVVKNKENHNNYIICIGRDITDRKKVEDQIKNQNVLLEKAVQEKQQEMELLMERLIRQEKLAAVGQISGNIAHELRNPLGAIKQSIFFLNRLAETDKLESASVKVKEHLDLLKKEIDESDRVITELLKSTKIGPLEKSQTNLRSVIEKVLERYPLEKNIQIKIDLKPGPFLIWADPLQIRQVILNLLSNGVQAVSGSGKITISAKKTAKNKICIIKIQDDGPGVAPENIGKVFEPLYSSKAKGIGLGLSICRQIIENHGGSITLTSKTGKGTTVSINLPEVKIRPADRVK